MNNLSNNTYVFDVGNRDKLRLGILNNVYNPFTQNALLELNIKNKKCIVDIACGQGELTCWMAEQIQPDGMVIGIDISDEQLALAQQLAQQKNIKNILFLKKSIFDLNSNDLPMCPDLIYCRWLLIHLENNKIKQAMKILYNLLSAGGMMVHEEVMLQESNTEGLVQSYKLYLKLFEKLAKKLDINFDLGSKLPQLFSEIGYQQPKIKLIKPRFSSEQLKFFQIDLESAISAFERFNITTENDINQLVQLMQKDIENGFDMSMTNYFVYGFK